MSKRKSKLDRAIEDLDHEILEARHELEILSATRERLCALKRAPAGDDDEIDEIPAAAGPNGRDILE